MLSLLQSIYRSFVSSLKFYIVDTVHPTTFELVVCWAFPAYILDKIKPCNLDLVKQFTRITRPVTTQCLRSCIPRVQTDDGRSRTASISTHGRCVGAGLHCFLPDCNEHHSRPWAISRVHQHV